MTTPSLHPLMRAEFSAAKLWLRVAGAVQWLAVGVALVPLVYATRTTQFIAAATAFAVPIALFFLRQQAAPHQVRGERLRRFHLLLDGTGRPPPKDELADLVAGRTSLRSFDPTLDGDYFSSKFPPGQPRLVDNLMESAFYTKETSSTAARLYGGLALTGILFTGGLVFYWLNTYSGTLDKGSADYAQIVAALVVFFGVGHLADCAFAFRELNQESDAVYRETVRLRHAATSELDADELHALLARYDCAVLRAPPVPGQIYKLRRRRLDEAWRMVFGSA